MLYVGLSGYSYKEWKGEGRFYPEDLKQKDFFKYYCEHYNAVEMDGTWYRMPTENGVQTWLNTAPDDFKYTFKAHRNVSHKARLKPESISSMKFMLNRLAPIEKAGKLACVFVQLPPTFKRNDERLREFFSTVEQGHPYAIEFRNETWFVPEVEEILKEFNVSWVSWDTEEVAGQRRDTGPFLYARMRQQDYTDDLLRSWADWFKQGIANGKDVYVFFKHEDLGQPWVFADRLLYMM